MSNTPIHDWLHADWTKATDVAYSRGVLTERTRVLKAFNDLENPSAALFAFIESVFAKDLAEPTEKKVAKRAPKKKI